MKDRIERAINLLYAVVREMRGDEPKFPESAKKEMALGICLICKEKIKPSDSSQPSTRGLHHKCFKAVSRDIEKGQSNEFELVEKGLLAPKQKGGRKRLKTKEIQSLESEVAEKNKAIERRVSRKVDAAVEEVVSSYKKTKKRPGK